MKKTGMLKYMTLMAFIFTMFSVFVPSISAQAQEGDNLEFDQQMLNQGLEDDGVLRVGMEANYAPFNWSQTSDENGAIPIANSSGEYVNGYDAQMAQEIADKLGLELEVIKLEWDGLPPALQSGRIDAIIAGMSPTPERERQIDFSDGYYESDLVLVTRADADIADATSLDDLAGSNVTGQMNTFHYELIEQIPDVNQQQAMDSFPTMITSVLSGKTDAYISEAPGAMAAVAANSDLAIIEFEEGQGFDTSEYNTTIAAGLRQDSPLSDPINEVLATIPQEDRDQLMEDMVELNERGESQGFWSDIAGIWTNFSSQFIRAAINTLFISLTATIVGFILGLIIAIFRSIPIRKSNNPIGYFFYKFFDLLVSVYIEVFRGTPMMVQAMLIFYGSKLFFNIDMTPMSAALLIVSINTSAYLAEIIRGGIYGVDDGQTEAAKAIGMNHYQTMTNVVLPQAIRSIMPALGNEFVINIKDTSVLNVIAVSELFFVTRSVAGSTYMTFQTFFITAIIYLILTFTTTRILRFIENRMDGKKNYDVFESSTMPTVEAEG